MTIRINLLFVKSVELIKIMKNFSITMISNVKFVITFSNILNAENANNFSMYKEMKIITIFPNKAIIFLAKIPHAHAIGNLMVKGDHKIIFEGMHSR